LITSNITASFNEKMGIKSFILLRERKTIDFPNPEGPFKDIIKPFLRPKISF
tara:strand:+ start:465 stop:620 length:156 start_codon:yes stop_codon:yes gene_type:complete